MLRDVPLRHWKALPASGSRRRCDAIRPARTSTEGKVGKKAGKKAGGKAAQNAAPAPAALQRLQEMMRTSSGR